MSYSYLHLSDQDLLHQLAEQFSRTRLTTAATLVHLGEVDLRKIYLRAGYRSMYAYCVGDLGMHPQAALKRIRAARVARRFPAILGAVADGRLHLSAVVALGPRLTPENVHNLVAATAHKSAAQIARILGPGFRPASDQDGVRS